MQAIQLAPASDSQSSIGEIPCLIREASVVSSIGIGDVLRSICSFQSGKRGADWNPTDGDLCVENGHLSLISMLDSTGRSMIFTSNATEYAACAGNLPLLKHLYSHKHLQPNTLNAFNCAAIHGHLDICKWMHKELKAEATAWAMDGAARNGHECVVKWLHSNRTEGCTTRAFNGASMNGHIEIVKFLFENRSEGGTSWAMHGAAINGHTAVIEFHLNHCPWAKEATVDAVDLAAINGKFEVVKYLHEHAEASCTRWGLEGARDMGYSEIVEYLHAHGCVEESHGEESLGDITEPEDAYENY